MKLVHIIKIVAELIGALADSCRKEAKPWAIRSRWNRRAVTVLAETIEKAALPQGLAKAQIEDFGV